MVRDLMKQISEWRARLRQGGTPDAVLALRNEACEWAASARAGVQAEMRRVYAAYDRLYQRWFTEVPSDPTPVPLYYQSMASTLLDLGGWCLLLLEAGLSAALMVLLTAIPPLWAALTGVAIAFALCFGAKAIFTPILARDEETPLAARDRLLRILVPLAVGEFGLLGLALLIRAVSADDWAEPLAPLFAVAVGFLSVSTPAISAILFLLARLYGWSRRLAREHNALDRLDRDLEGLQRGGERRQVDARQDKDDGATGAPPLARVACVATLTAAALLAGNPLHGAAATQPRGVVWEDVTWSVEPAHLRAGLDIILEALPRITVARGTYTWTLIRFADDAWYAAPSYSVTLPPPESRDCPTVRLSEAQLIFRGFATKRLKRAQDECNRRWVVANQAYHQALARAVDGLRQAVAGPQWRSARCTALYDVLHRAALSPRGSTVLILTDGLESCRRAPILLPGLTEGTVVMVLIVSPRGLPAASGATHFAERAALLKRVAPWARVLAPWQLADEFPPATPPVSEGRRVAAAE